MQSGFGGVSEIQQFMMDGSAAHTLFSISSTTPPQPNPTSSSAANAGGQELRFPATSAPAHKFINPFHAHHPPPPPASPYFSHFHSIPITQQLFTPPPQPHHHHHHHFQLFHPDPENSGCPQLHPGGGGATPSFLASSMNFKLAVDNSGGGGGIQDGLNNDTDVAGSILQGDDASESRLPPWHREEDCAIKEPFWRPLDLDYINRNNKRCKDKEPAVDVGHFVKRSRESGELKNFHAMAAAAAAADGNYKIFSELEAIYKPGGSNSTTSEGATNNNATTNQTTGSGSALTGDDHLAMPLATAAAAPKPDSRLDDDNSNSTGGEAHTNSKAARHTSRRRRRRRQHQMGSIVAFFQGLVKQVMDQQEALHEKFLDAMERRDQERAGREETWREQEAVRSQREAAARTHDRVISAAREATIFSFLEKITGETLQLPAHPQLLSYTAAGGSEEKEYNAELGGPSQAMMTTSRWPKAEVQALIRVRSGFEGRFQEPGLKGPMWEEVSGAMAALGYRRSAKRCKEKWENINKYFRKAKDSGRKRPQQSKTCTYFQQLDQLYSKADLTKSASPPRGGDGENNLISSCELLDADILVGAGERQGFGEGEEVGESEGSKRAEEEEEAEESSPCFERLQ